MADAVDKKETWLNYLALTTVILAVCATMATFKGGGFSTKAVLSQAQASDQWAYFQSKGIKSYMYDLQKDQLEMQLLRKNLPEEATTLYTKKIATYSAKIAKYEAERAKIQEDAKRLEAMRDDAQRHGRPFGFAVIFLQIAILLSSIAALLKKKPVWIAGLVVGLYGLIQFANGFFLFM